MQFIIQIKNQEKDDYHQKSFEISTPGCKIPQFDPFDEAILSYVSNNTYSCGNKAQLVYSNDTHLVLNYSAFSDYNLTGSLYPDCYFESFWRVEPESTEADNLVEYGDKVHFNETARINDEFIRVKCEENSSLIYTDFYDFIPTRGMETLAK